MEVNCYAWDFGGILALLQWFGTRKAGASVAVAVHLCMPRVGASSKKPLGRGWYDGTSKKDTILDFLQMNKFIELGHI